MTIDGDGFMPTITRLYIIGTNYSYVGSENYSQIIFRTPQELTWKNHNLNVSVYVGMSSAICLMPSCYFAWLDNVTSYFDSVAPSEIRDATNLTITGRNLNAGDKTTADFHVTINNNPCNITEVTNDSVMCTLMKVEAGEHPIIGSIDGLFLYKILVIK